MTTTVRQREERIAKTAVDRPVSFQGMEAETLLKKFPPRACDATWPATTLTHNEVLNRLDLPPVRADTKSAQGSRMVGARLILRWLNTFPGGTWQERWLASTGASSRDVWNDEIMKFAHSLGRKPPRGCFSAGILALILADIVRPHLSWVSTRSSRQLQPLVARTRDPEGFAWLESTIPLAERQTTRGKRALRSIAQIIAATGGGVRDVRVGDYLALLKVVNSDLANGVRLGYTWLRERGQFEADAPTTLFFINGRSGQLTSAELVDRYRLQCRPVRDLIVEYLTERQPSLDYVSLKALSLALAGRFWADLEQHHPGIDSLRLDPEASSAWKSRLATKTHRKRLPDGTVATVVEPRKSAAVIKTVVRSFYLDIAQWAADAPERWGQWSVPCPISEAECSVKKSEQRQKARKDQRTRERLPVLPVLVRIADRRLKEARARLDALQAVPLGGSFTVLGETFTRPRSTTTSAEDQTRAVSSTGKMRELGAEERRAFWAWATVEVLRQTGIRIEELVELSHHSIIRYQLPSTGETVPLLQVAPSKTDQERMLLISPELADVLSTIVSRVRGVDGAIPSIRRYDEHEKVWDPAMPLLFQWTIAGETRSISMQTLRKSLNELLAASGLTDNTGAPLKFEPHDFRRIFITDAILNGMPPHITQVIAGHENIETTLSYNTIYPSAVIEAHRSFIARRRKLRPVEEYRAVTPEEWDEFLGHFERRKLSLGECGRAYGSDCVHEHACIRCPVLIIGSTDRSRLVEVRDNLFDRITEAEREGWLGDVEGLGYSLSAAEEKIAQLDARVERTQSPVFLGVPKFDQIGARLSNVQESTRRQST
ncbi:tyrosine-type recombinase/integrase [Streptomyces sp. NPDC005227]|uniref:tyrosine-type recombinase/integrase n=1 Tax=Streptomyces sp. NPDC005227 TaxID=3364707 RepID=UPI003690097C